MARIVIQNALFFGRARVSRLTMPWCTYTDPEIAHVGLYEHEAQEQGIAVQTFVQPLHDVDRADPRRRHGWLRQGPRSQGEGSIVGATIVARHAGEMISEMTLAMVGGSAWARWPGPSIRIRRRRRRSRRWPTPTTAPG